jgi:transcriptional regulator with XRE-family HTH domain
MTKITKVNTEEHITPLEIEIFEGEDENVKEDEVALKILQHLADRLQYLRDHENITEKELAKRLGVSPATINHWINRNRFKGIRFIHAFRALQKVGGDMRQVLREVLGEDDAVIVLALMEDQPEIFRKIVSLLARDDERSEKLRREVDYLHRDGEKE